MTEKMLNQNCQELLLEYAAGTLSPAGRRYVADCEKLGGALVAHLCDPVDVSDACLEKLLEMIDCADADCAGKKPCCNETCIPCDEALPAPLANLLPPGKAVDMIWQQHGGASVMTIPLSCRKSRAALMRYEPGATFIPSAGRGSEIILVLEGSLRGGSEEYCRGDLVLSGEDISSAGTASGCFCLCVTTPSRNWNSLFDRLRRWMSLKN